MQEDLLALQTLTKARVETAFANYIRVQAYPDSQLLQAMRYALFNGGKRMRPLLIMLVANMLGGDQDDVDTVALAVECIHAYSLVHDDLPAMDDDALRRGKPTCHIEFDEATAILAGDALQTLAFEILANHALSDFANSKRIALISELAKASGANGMCQGQSLDLIATNEDISIDALNHLHSLKTGALLTACVRMGALICSQTSADDLANLTSFANHIGLAFQIQDDILDVISDTETLGKPQGSDQSNNKNTFVSKLGLEGAQTQLKAHHQEALHALDTLPYNTAHLKLFTDYMVTRTF
ncbi:(2E,6E)-farnesyl diphosphate synthase [Glaciecola siphonariae]|uniref:(2E,6E)-farnesyl diphosphate synthase n=1 Tax=Glaciecola siphonariae TaxID=521012 RepID=A0ABV9LZ07_9ALTE